MKIHKIVIEACQGDIHELKNVPVLENVLQNIQRSIFLKNILNFDFQKFHLN